MSGGAGSVAGALEKGTLIDGKYAVEKVIGEGGMGVVYLARDVHAESPVVIKAIRHEHTHRQDFRERTLAEGRALARIDHPNIVRLNAIVIEPSGALYLVMQYIEGEALDAMIKRLAREGRPFTISEALRIFCDVLSGIAAVHREGIIHRDIKPANILTRARDGAVKVTDFGIAKPEDDAKEGRGQTKGTIGSAWYMAPEQVRGVRSVDKRVDIYALGIVLFELLAGRVPFAAESTFEVMMMQVNAPLPSVSAWRPDAPAFLEGILQKACAKQPEDRFASCEAFLDALRAGMASMGDAATREPAPRIAPPPPAASRARPKPFLAVAAIAIIVAGAAAALVSYSRGWLGDSDEQPASGSGAPAPDKSGMPISGLGTSGAPAPAPVGNGAPAESAPPARLAGVWKSDSGRIYDVVWSGGAFEFRVRDPAQFAGQGYEPGEPRFVLRPAPGEMDVFLVEDRIRPFSPDGTSYDPARSRASCRVDWSEVGGRPLRAQLDGDRLRVRMAMLTPKSTMFDVESGRVIGCKGLAGAPASEIDSMLTRQ